MTKEEMKKTLQERKEQIITSIKENKKKSIAIVTALSIMTTVSFLGMMACQKNNNLVPIPTETTIETTTQEVTTTVKVEEPEPTATPIPTTTPTEIEEAEKIELEGLMAEFPIMSLPDNLDGQDVYMVFFEMNGEKKVIFARLSTYYSETKGRETGAVVDIFSEQIVFISDSEVKGNNFFEKYGIFENENITNMYARSLRGYSLENNLINRYEKVKPTLRTNYDALKVYTSGEFFDESMVVTLPHSWGDYEKIAPHDYREIENELQKLLREEQEAKTKVKR